MKREEAALPPGWAWTTLGEISLAPQYGWTTSAIAEGSLHLLRTSDITSGRIDWDDVPFCRDEPPDKDKYLLHDGDIVISRAGSVGHSLLLRNPKPAIFASYLIRFKPLVDAPYIAYFLQGPDYWQAISERSLGIAIPNVNATKLKQILLPLAPLPEQRRIVAKIEELLTRLDAGVAALKRVQAALKRYKAAVLKAACEGRLVLQDPSGEPASQLLARILAERRAKREAHLRAKGKDPKKAKYPEPKAPDTASLPELPEGWCWVHFDQIAEDSPHALKAGPFGSALKKETYVPSGFKVYGQEQVIRGDPFFGDYFIDKERYEALESCAVKPGDILISLVGTIGRILILPESALPGIINPRLVKISADKRVVDAKYVKSFLESSQVQHFFEAGSHGETMGVINLKTIRLLPIPLPPFTEQHRIVAEVERRLSVVQELEQAVRANLARAQRLRQAIHKRAFEGKLVPQDPSDEPASVLLERIRARRGVQLNALTNALTNARTNAPTRLHRKRRRAT